MVRTIQPLNHFLISIMNLHHNTNSIYFNNKKEAEYTRKQRIQNGFHHRKYDENAYKNIINV